MNQDQEKELIKDFLQNLSYPVFHEVGRVKATSEHYFLGIRKEQIKKNVQRKYLEKYINDYPLSDFSKKTVEYMEENKNEIYFIFIDTILHADPFFKEKDNFIRENANNIISMRMIGEVADITSHLENKLDIYFEQFKGVSLSAGLFAKEKAKEIFSEKAPIIKQGLQNLGDKVTNKLKLFSKRKP